MLLEYRLVMFGIIEQKFQTNNHSQSSTVEPPHQVQRTWSTFAMCAFVSLWWIFHSFWCHRFHSSYFIWYTFAFSHSQSNHLIRVYSTKTSKEKKNKRKRNGVYHVHVNISPQFSPYISHLDACLQFLLYVWSFVFNNMTAYIFYGWLLFNANMYTDLQMCCCIRTSSNALLKASDLSLYSYSKWLLWIDKCRLYIIRPFVDFALSVAIVWHIHIHTDWWNPFEYGWMTLLPSKWYR